MSLFSALDDVLIEKLILKDTLFKEIELPCSEARFVVNYLPKGSGTIEAFLLGFDTVISNELDSTTRLLSWSELFWIYAKIA